MANPKGRKAEVWMDGGNLAQGYYASSETDPMATPSEEVNVELYSVRAIVQELMQDMGRKGYDMIPHLKGEWAGFKVYTKARMLIDGIEPEESWHFKKEVRGDAPEADTFLGALRLHIESLMPDLSEALRKVYQQIYAALADKPHDTKTILYNTAMGLSRRGDVRKRSLCGRAGANTFVPPLHWFSKELQALDPTELLTIMPEAERNIFCAVTGKMLAGRPGLNAMEGTLRYDMRAVIHLIDPEGGIGKSTLFRYMAECLRNLGYNVDVIDPKMDRFSNPWITSDFAYLDDNDYESITGVLTHTTTKSVATNAEEVFVNIKGVQGAPASANTTMYLASNVENVPSILKRMDKAQKSRHQPLRCYTPFELKRMHGDNWMNYCIKEYWTAKAEQLGCTIDVLMMRLFRHCLDLFLDLCGYEQGQELKPIREPRIWAFMNEQREQLRTDTDLTHRPELINGLLRMISLAITVNPAMQPILMKNINNLTLTPRMLLSLLGIWVNEGTHLPDYCAEMALPSLSRSQVAPVLKGNFGDLKTMVLTAQPAKSFTAIVTHLRTAKYNIPYASGKAGDLDLEQYTGLFAQSLSAIPLMVKELEGINLVETLPQYVLEAVSELSAQLR